MRFIRAICSSLTVFLRPADSFHALHDWVTVGIESGHPRLPEDTRGIPVYVDVADGKVYLPGEVVWEVKASEGSRMGSW